MAQASNESDAKMRNRNDPTFKWPRSQMNPTQRCQIGMIRPSNVIDWAVNALCVSASFVMGSMNTKVLDLCTYTVAHVLLCGLICIMHRRISSYEGNKRNMMRPLHVHTQPSSFCVSFGRPFFIPVSKTAFYAFVFSLSYTLLWVLRPSRRADGLVRGSTIARW